MRPGRCRRARRLRKAERAARKTLDLTRRQLDAGAVNVLALLSASGLPADQDSRVQAQAGA